MRLNAVPPPSGTHTTIFHVFDGMKTIPLGIVAAPNPLPPQMMSSSLVVSMRAAIIFKISPHALIVQRGLRHDVGHEKNELVDIGGVRAICRRAEMAAIEIVRADAVVIGGADAVEIRRQVCVGVKSGVAPAAANVPRRQIPACPNRLAQIVAVINRLDRALNEISARDCSCRRLRWTDCQAAFEGWRQSSPAPVTRQSKARRQWRKEKTGDASRRLTYWKFEPFQLRRCSRRYLRSVQMRTCRMTRGELISSNQRVRSQRRKPRGSRARLNHAHKQRSSCTV